MNRISIKTNYIQNICWFDNSIIDWSSAGNLYTIDGKAKQLFKYTYGFGDCAITSDDGKYSFIFQRLGTKGLLLKNGEILREINRSYYQADIYEYPAAFITLNDKTYLIHCPKKYCRIDIEDVETGEILTDIPNRNPNDFFHSRFEISPNGKYLMSKGWHWHPWDSIQLFELEKCLLIPSLLDNCAIQPNVGTEICTASFLDDNLVLIGSSNEEALNDELNDNLPPKHLAIWDIELDSISKPIKVKVEFGNLFVINEKYAWDTYKFPKVINIETGEVIDKDERIQSGIQKSSIIGNLEKNPSITFNFKTKQLAILIGKTIEIIEYETK